MEFWLAERTCATESGSVLMETTAEVTQAASALGVLPAGGAGDRHTGLRIHAHNGDLGGTKYAIWADGRIVNFDCL